MENANIFLERDPENFKRIAPHNAHHPHRAHHTMMRWSRGPAAQRSAGVIADLRGTITELRKQEQLAARRAAAAAAAGVRSVAVGFFTRREVRLRFGRIVTLYNRSST